MLEWSLEGKGGENQGWTPSSCNGQLGWCKNYLGKQEKLLRSCGSCDGITGEEGMPKWWNTLFQWDNSSQPLPLCRVFPNIHLPAYSISFTPCLLLHHFLFLTLFQPLSPLYFLIFNILYLSLSLSFFIRGCRPSWGYPWTLLRLDLGTFILFTSWKSPGGWRSADDSS